MESRSPIMTIDEMLTREISPALRSHLNMLHTMLNTKVYQAQVASDRQYYDNKKSQEEKQIETQLFESKKREEAIMFDSVLEHTKDYQRYLEEQNKEYEKVYAKINLDEQEILENNRKEREREFLEKTTKLIEEKAQELEKMRIILNQKTIELHWLRASIEGRGKLISDFDLEIKRDRDALANEQKELESNEERLIEVDANLSLLEKEKGEIEEKLKRAAETSAQIKEEKTQLEARFKDARSEISSLQEKQKEINSQWAGLFAEREGLAKSLFSAVPPAFSFDLQGKEKITVDSASIVETILDKIKQDAATIDVEQLDRMIEVEARLALKEQISDYYMNDPRLTESQKRKEIANIENSLYFQLAVMRLSNSIIANKNDDVLKKLNENGAELSLASNTKLKHDAVVSEHAHSVVIMENRYNAIKREEKTNLREAKDLKLNLSENKSYTRSLIQQKSRLEESIKKCLHSIATLIKSITNKEEKREKELHTQA